VDLAVMDSKLLYLEQVIIMRPEVVAVQMVVLEVTAD
jgi:hypothetical protein